MPPKDISPPDRSTDRLHVHKLSIYLLSVAKNPGSLVVEVDERRQECFGGAELEQKATKGMQPDLV